MICNKCQTQLKVDEGGTLYCPQCNPNIKRSIKCFEVRYNDVIFYKIVGSENIIVPDDILLPEEIDKLIKDKVTVKYVTK